MEKLKKLHELLVSQKIDNKSFEEFSSNFSGNPEKQRKLHDLLVQKKIDSKPFEEFQANFFAEEPVQVKKKESASALPSQDLGQSPVSGKQQGTVSAPTTKAPTQPQQPVAKGPVQQTPITGTIGLPEFVTETPAEKPLQPGQGVLAQPKQQPTKQPVQTTGQAPTPQQQAPTPQQQAPKFGEEFTRRVLEAPTEESLYSYLTTINPNRYKFKTEGPLGADPTAISTAYSERTPEQLRGFLKETVFELNKIKSSDMSNDVKALMAKDLIRKKLVKYGEPVGETKPITDDLIISEAAVRNSNPRGFNQVIDERIKSQAIDTPIVEGWSKSDPFGSYKNKMISQAFSSSYGTNLNDPMAKEAFLVTRLERLKNADPSVLNSPDHKERIKKFETEIDLLRKERIESFRTKIEEANAKLEEIESLGNYDSAALAQARKELKLAEDELDGYLNPDKAAVVVYSSNPTISLEAGETPMDKMKNHLARLVHERNEIRSQISTGENIAGFILPNNERQKRLAELESQIKTLTPVVLLNTGPRTSNVEEGSFFDAAIRSMTKTVAPGGLFSDLPISQQEGAQNILGAMVQSGIDLSVYNPDKLNDLKERTKGYGLGDSRYWGELLGGTAGYLLPGFVGGALTQPFKISKAIKGTKFLGRLTNIAADAVDSGAAYMVGGTLLPRYEDMTFVSGALGGVFGNVGKNILPLIPFLNKEGKNFLVNRIAAGIAETGEEFGNTIGEAWKQYGMDGFWEGMKEKFPNADETFKFVISTFALGTVMGSGTEAGRAFMRQAQEEFENATPEQQRAMQPAIDEIFDESVAIQQAGSDDLKNQSSAKGAEQQVTPAAEEVAPVSEEVTPAVEEAAQVTAAEEVAPIKYDVTNVNGVDVINTGNNYIDGWTENKTPVSYLSDNDFIEGKIMFLEFDLEDVLDDIKSQEEKIKEEKSKSTFFDSRKKQITNSERRIERNKNDIAKINEAISFFEYHKNKNQGVPKIGVATSVEEAAPVTAAEEVSPIAEPVAPVVEAAPVVTPEAQGELDALTQRADEITAILREDNATKQATGKGQLTRTERDKLINEVSDINRQIQEAQRIQAPVTPAVQMAPTAPIEVKQLSAEELDFKGDLASQLKQQVTPQEVQRDQEDIQRLPSEERIGQEPVQAEPIEGAGREAVAPGGMVQEQGQEVAPVARTEAGSKRAYDFDDTLYDPKTKKLTPLGEEVKARIAAGEDVTIVTARNSRQTGDITKALGISKDKIQATGSETKKGEVLDNLGIDRNDYYDADQAKMQAIQTKAEPVAEVETIVEEPAVTPEVKAPATKPTAPAPAVATMQPVTAEQKAAVTTGDEISFNYKSPIGGEPIQYTGKVVSEGKDATTGLRKLFVETEVEGNVERLPVFERDIVAKKTAEPAVEAKPKAEEAKPKTSPKKTANRIRQAKIDTKGKAFDATIGLPIALWNQAIEMVALAVEGGMALADAIKKGIDFINKQQAGKKWNEDEFRKKVQGLEVSQVATEEAGDVSPLRKEKVSIDKVNSDLLDSMVKISGMKMADAENVLQIMMATGQSMVDMGVYPDVQAYLESVSFIDAKNKDVSENALQQAGIVNSIFNMLGLTKKDTKDLNKVSDIIENDISPIASVGHVDSVDLFASRAAMSDLISRLEDKVGFGFDGLFELDVFNRGRLDLPILEIIAKPLFKSIKSDDPSSLYQKLLKELSVGYGKTVFDRVANSIEFKSSSLENQQYQAISVLLGEVAAKKIKEKEASPNLISLLKKLLGQMTDTVRSVFNSREVDVTKLSADMTLNDLANLIAFRDSKLLFPGYAAEYTTPDGRKFMSYAEASRHVSKMFNEASKALKDNTGKRATNKEVIAFVRDAIKKRQHHLSVAESANDKLLKILDKRAEESSLATKNSTQEWIAFLEKKKAEKDQLVKPLEEKAEALMNSATRSDGSFDMDKFRLVSGELITIRKQIEEITSQIDDKYKPKDDEFRRKINELILDVHEKYKPQTDPLQQIIAENKEKARNFIDRFLMTEAAFLASKNAIEKWISDNSIKYNPEEAYSRGEGFYSYIGAYADLDVEVLLQGLIRSIENNRLAGSDFILSAVTSPVGKRPSFAQETVVTVKIFPSSKDIKWAGVNDVISGTVSDSYKPFTADKSIAKERAGIAYTKYPGSSRIDAIRPSIAEVIDQRNRYNELGIALTENNFRLEADSKSPQKVKDLVKKVNSVLDERYGKINEPVISTDSPIAPSITRDDVSSLNDTLSSISEKISFEPILRNLSIIANYDVARKDPRSLITSRVRPINEIQKEAEASRSALQQANNAQFRIENDQRVVEILKDLSEGEAVAATLHEAVFHGAMTDITTAAANGNAKAKAHLDTIVKEYNKANNANVTADEVIAGNDAFKAGKEISDNYRAVQEFFARAGERYLTEGPSGFSKAMQEILDAVKEVFQQVYKSIKNSAIDVPLTPELEAVFEDILGKNVTQQISAKASPQSEVKAALDKMKNAWGAWLGSGMGVMDSQEEEAIKLANAIDATLNFGAALIKMGVTDLAEWSKQVKDTVQKTGSTWMDNLSDAAVKRMFEASMERAEKGVKSIQAPAKETEEEKAPEGQKVRKAYKSAKEKGGIDIDEVLAEQDKFYPPRKIADVTEYAKQFIKEKGTQGVIEYLRSGTTDFDTAVIAGKELLKYWHNQAKTTSDPKAKAEALRNAADVASELFQLGSRLGQGVNAYKGYAEGMMLFGPEFMLKFATKRVAEVRKKILGRTEKIDQAAAESINEGTDDAKNIAINSNSVTNAIDEAINESKPETILGLTKEQIRARQAKALAKARAAFKGGELLTGADIRPLLDAVAAVAEYGFYLAAEGVVNFKTWSARIKKEIPNITDDILQKAWQTEYEGITPEMMAAKISATDKLSGIMADKKDKASDPLRQVADIVRKKIKGRTKSEPKSPTAQLAEAVTNAERYADAWNTARAEVINKIQNGPGTDSEKQSKIDALNNALDEAIGQPFSDSLVKKAIKKEMEARNQTMKDVLKDYDLAKMTADEVAKKIAEDTGLAEEQAKKVADAVKKEFDNNIKKARRAALLRNLGAEGKIYFDFVDKVGEKISPDEWNKYLAEKYKLPTLDDETIQQLNDVAEQAASLPEGSYVQSKTGAEAMKILADINGIDKAGLFWDLHYAKMLGSFKTHARNIIGNFYNAVTEIGITGIEQLIRNGDFFAGFNSAMGFLNAAATMGQLMSREVAATGIVVKGSKFEAPGTIESIRKGQNIFKWAGTPGQKATQMLTYAKYVGRALAAEDAFFFQASRGMRMREIIREEVIKNNKLLGLKKSQKQIWKEVNDILYGTKAEQAAAKRTVEYEAQKFGYTKREKALRYYEIMEERIPSKVKGEGERVGAFISYNYKPVGILGGLSEMISNFKAKNSRNKLLNLIIPFTRVPANVLNQQLSFTPVGVLRAMTKSGRAEFDLITSEQRNRELIKGVLGTTMMTMAMYPLIAEFLLGERDDEDKEKFSFKVHGPGPKNYDMRVLMESQGWMPYSVELTINGKTTFIPYQQSPFALPLTIAGTLKDTFASGNFSQKEYSDIAWHVAAKAMASVSDRSFLSGLGDAFEILSGDERAGKKLERMFIRSTNPMPNFVPEIAGWVDGLLGDKDELKYKPTDFGSEYIKNLPVVRDMYGLKPDLDVFGRPIKNTSSSPFSLIAREKTPDTVVDFMVENGLSIEKPGPTTKINGELATEDQLRRIVELSGPQIYKSIQFSIPTLRMYTDKDIMQTHINAIRTSIIDDVKFQVYMESK